MNFQYFDEKTNTYKNILNNIPIEDNLKNWFSTWAGSQSSERQMFTSRADAKKYCEDNNTQLIHSRSRTTGKTLGVDAWYKAEYGYSYKPGEATGTANNGYNGPAICLNTKDKHTIDNDIVAYKFKFSTDNLQLPRNIYNIFMKGKIGSGYLV